MGFEERGKALEDAFFAKKNVELLEQVRKDLNAKENRSELKEATGIDEDDMLDRILAVGVNTESLAALTIAPMVLVAWANGTVAAKERDAVMTGAAKSGITSDSVAGKLLQGWLDEQPGDDLATAWKDYTKAICEKLQAGDQAKLKDQVLGRSKKVAEAAGGFLGLGSISAKEAQVLDSLTSTFE